MLGLKKSFKDSNVSSKETMVDEGDEFQIPTLVLCKTPSQEEMQRRRKISSLRKQYGIRIEDTDAAM